jgi:FAD/FMN-containing dehydrogenase
MHSNPFGQLRLDVLKTLTKFGVRFAVRGGEHTLNAGASNINSGVVISLRSMNTVMVNGDKTLVTIGEGAKWREVYSDGVV